MDMSELALEHIRGVVTSFRKGLILDRFSKFAKGEIFILNCLRQRGETALPSELSEKLGSSTARVATALGALEKKGLITREMDKTDRRKIIVTITDAGNELAYRENEQLMTWETRIFEKMGTKDAKEFIRLHKLYLELSEEVEAEKIEKSEKIEAK
ncbi:MAG: winged helix DNA-binding protein [Clostridiales Family XIII bacterium]|nr:winged helix DNA-binding protein [Clostridiales Family XIII bacterium]